MARLATTEAVLMEDTPVIINQTNRSSSTKALNQKLIICSILMHHQVFQMDSIHLLDKYTVALTMLNQQVQDHQTLVKPDQ